MPNMGKIIKSHNSKLLNTSNNNNRANKTCNCQRRQECPLNGECNKENVVYLARVAIREHNETLNQDNLRPAATNPLTTENERELNETIENNENTMQTITPNNEIFYIGAAENFKQRYRNHIKSFRHEQYQKETALSKYIWTLKSNNQNYSIDWNILKRTSGYNKITKRCNLCLNEKLEICNFKKKHILLNKRNELINKCRHENKHLLANLPDP